MSETNPSSPPESALFRYSVIAARVLMGLAFVVFGLNKFLQFLTLPPFPEKAGAFFGALLATGYMIPLVAVTEIVSGALLVIGRFVPLALVMITPVVVNILLFSAFLDPAGSAAGL